MTPERAEPEAPAAARVAERALAYEPGEGLTEARIARAQQAARAQPDAVAPLDTLAALFLRRYRETADPEHLRRAEDAVGAALDRDEADALALSLSGILAMQAHRFGDARDVARRILARDRQDTTALLLLGDAHLELGDYTEALEAYQRALDLRPDLRSYNRGAYVRWLHGDPQGALEMLALAIDAGSVSDPESTAWCWVDLAHVHWNAGNRAQVRVALDRALALVPSYAPAVRLGARFSEAEGDRAAAIAALEGLLARSETVGDLLDLAELLEAEGRLEQAQARVTRAERLEREDPRALALYRARRDTHVEQALRATRRELAARHDIQTLAAHALALARSGRHDEARTVIARATALGTSDAKLALIEALVRHLGGDSEGAAAAMERARASNPAADPWLFAHLEATLAR